jgi:hypothetical protein
MAFIGNEANEVAVYAYYFLVVGVVFELAAFVRDECRKRAGVSCTLLKVCGSL